MHIVSIISHTKQPSWYYYSHPTGEETKLRSIKQVTQGELACDGAGFEPRTICLFPIRHPLDALSKKTTAKSTINLAPTRQAPSCTFRSLHPSPGPRNEVILALWSPLAKPASYLDGSEADRTSVGTRAGIKLSVESANVGVLAHTIWTTQHRRNIVLGQGLEKQQWQEGEDPLPQYGCEE